VNLWILEWFGDLTLQENLVIVVQEEEFPKVPKLIINLGYSSMGTRGLLIPKLFGNSTFGNSGEVASGGWKTPESRSSDVDHSHWMLEGCES
jgi:hypothetical protein